jgi:hypothetical protein
MLNGLHLLIVALNQLSGECGQVTEQFSGTVIRSRREVQFRQREWRRVVVIWTGIPGADAQIDLLDGCNEQFNMRLCRYTGTDLVGVLTLLSWGWTSDGYVNGPQKASTVSAKVVAVRHIWWHTMQDCQRGDESVRETLWG